MRNLQRELLEIIKDQIEERRLVVKVLNKEAAIWKRCKHDNAVTR